MSILCLHIAFLFLGQFEYFMLKVFHTLSFKWLGLELPSSRSLVTYNASVVQMFAYPFQKRKLISNYHSDTQVNFFELPVDRVVAIVDLTCWLWLMYFITHPSGGKLKTIIQSEHMGAVLCGCPTTLLKKLPCMSTFLCSGTDSKEVLKWQT